MPEVKAGKRHSSLVSKEANRANSVEEEAPSLKEKRKREILPSAKSSSTKKWKLIG